MEKNAKIYLAGHTGLLGKAIMRRLKKQGYSRIITRPHKKLDLTQQAEVEKFFKKSKLDYVFLCAARVGGLRANMNFPAEFICENLAIQTNVLSAAYKYGVRKLIFLGSGCSYPAQCRQPIKEEYLLSGYLEPTNQEYAVAKIAGITMCQAYNRQYGANFICAVATTMYGPNDSFDPEDCHVIPALIMKFHQAKINKKPEVIIWGSGKPLRDFIYVDDAADGCILLMNKYNSPQIINIATGQEVSIRVLANLLKDTLGFKGRIIFDRSKPDGMTRKVLDVSKAKELLGWKAKTPLKKGLRLTYNWYLKNKTALS
jgi:GDP-L-fucose synthase